MRLDEAKVSRDGKRDKNWVLGCITVQRSEGWQKEQMKLRSRNHSNRQKLKGVSYPGGQKKNTFQGRESSKLLTGQVKWPLDLAKRMQLVIGIRAVLWKHGKILMTLSVSKSLEFSYDKSKEGIEGGWRGKWGQKRMFCWYEIEHPLWRLMARFKRGEIKLMKQKWKGELPEQWVYVCKRGWDWRQNERKWAWLGAGRVQLTYREQRLLQFSSVAQSCPTLCNPMSRSTPGLPVHHQLPEFTQTHVHWVSDAIQPSHPLSSPSPPAFNLSRHQGLFKWLSSLHQVAKVLEFQLQHQSLKSTPRTDFL